MSKTLNIPSVEEIEKHLEKIELEEDLYNFLLWLFKVIKREEFLENWHHRKICDALMKVYRGELLHLIINLPPRYTKTEIVVKSFVAWCLAKNPKCKFIHLSYSDDLALDNSSAIKEIVISDEFQHYWPMELKRDSFAKKKWFTEIGGGVYATSAGGQITGFGAGTVAANEFGGAIIIDDGLKPDEATSDTIRNAVNNRFNTTIKNRTNNPRKTPIIIVMQRLHEDDLSGFLLNGGSELEFHHLNLPALNEDGPSEFDPREKGEALWPEKHDEEELEKMRLADAGTFAGQYQQRPAPKEGNIFQHFQFYKEVPKDTYYKVHSWDMTFKEKSKNKKKKTDFVVGTEWGKSVTNGDIFLFPDMVRARMGFVDTKEAVEIFTKNHPDFKAILIEDKANGSAIIDSLRKKFKRIIEVEPEGDKTERAEAIAPLFKAKNIWLPHPSIAPWIMDFINELKVFPNGKHDDQVDSATQAISYLDKIGSVGSLDKYNHSQAPFRKSKHKRKSRIKVGSD